MRRERVGTPPGGIEAEIAAERESLLRDLLESRAWTEILRPGLLRKADRIARMLAVDANRTLDEIRGLQGQYRALIALSNTDTDDLTKWLAAEP